MLVCKIIGLCAVCVEFVALQYFGPVNTSYRGGTFLESLRVYTETALWWALL